MGMAPKDLGMTSGDHLLLNVGCSKEKLCHCSLITVFGDPSDTNLLTDQKASEMISSLFSWNRLSSLAAEFRGVDASESNLLASGSRAGIAVVAAPYSYQFSPCRCLARSERRIRVSRHNQLMTGT